MQDVGLLAVSDGVRWVVVGGASKTTIIQVGDPQTYTWNTSLQYADVLLLGAGAGGFLLFYVPVCDQQNVRNAVDLQEYPFAFTTSGTRIIHEC